MCFFKFIEQDGVLIGRYKGWGSNEKGTFTRPDAVVPTASLSLGSLVEKIVVWFTPKKAKEDGQTGENPKNKFKDYSSHIFVNGDLCPNGSPRSAEVKYSCGGEIESSILSVIEVEICHYVFEVLTPLVCTLALQEEALDKVRALGVFGFSKSEIDVQVTGV